MGKKIDLSSLKSLGSIDIKNIMKNKKANDKKKKVSNKKEPAKNVIALDIGSNFIKVVEGKYDKGILKINNFFKIPTPEDSMGDGKILKADTLIDAMKFKFKEEGAKYKDAIITVNSSSIINREIIIPKVEEDEMETVIKYELQQYLPINLDEYIIDFMILDVIIDDQSMRLKLNVITFPERVAFAYYSLLNSLDKNAHALDVTYNSINKLSNYAKLSFNETTGKGGTVAFVDMGAATMNVTIIKDDKVDFTRIIKYGGNNINYSLNERLEIPINATESAKAEKTDITNVTEDDHFNIVMRDCAEDIVSEVQRVLQFYANKTTINKMDKIYIYGGTSNIKGLPEYMQEKIKIPVEKINMIEEIDFNSKKILEEPIGEYLNAIGSIIRL